MIDYVRSGQRMAKRASQGYVSHHIPFVTDHSAVMQAYDMWDEGWNAGEHVAEWNADINHMMQEWTPVWKYRHLVNPMKYMEKYGMTRAQRRGLARHNETTTEKRARGERHATQTQKHSTQVCRRLWQARCKIRAERQPLRFGQVLTHQDGGETRCHEDHRA